MFFVNLISAQRLQWRYVAEDLLQSYTCNYLIHAQIIIAAMSALSGIIYGICIKLRSLRALRRVAAAADLDFVVGTFPHSLICCIRTIVVHFALLLTIAFAYDCSFIHHLIKRHS